jgi:hypothetical protein
MDVPLLTLTSVCTHFGDFPPKPVLFYTNEGKPNYYPLYWRGVMKILQADGYAEETKDMIISFLIFFFSLLFYVVSLAPTVLWGDSAKLALYVYQSFISFDLVGGHQLHTIIGKIFSFLPIGDFAYKQNLMSAFFGSLTLSLLFSAMRNFSITRSAAFIACSALAVSHTFWMVSAINESYTLSLSFIAALLWLMGIFDKANNKNLILCIFSFLLALSLTNGLLPIFMIPAFIYYFGLFENRKLLFKRLFGIAVFFVLGSLMNMYIYFNYSTGSAGGVSVVSSLLSSFKSFSHPEYFLKEFIKYPVYLFYQFILFSFFIGVLGIKEMFNKNKKLLIFILVNLFCYILFSSNYMLQRKFYILTPTYLLFAIYLGFGCDAVFKKSGVLYKQTAIVFGCLVLLLIVLPIGVYAYSPNVLRVMKVNPVNIRSLPFRDNISFYMFPGKRNEHGARDYALAALNSVDPNSIILADFTPGMVIKYIRDVEGIRKDVTIEELDRYLFNGGDLKKDIANFVEKNIKTHEIYLADDEWYYCIDYLKKSYKIEKQGVLYKISGI